MILDKLKYGAINNKKIIYFLIGLSVLGLTFGSFFLTFISKNDQTVVRDYMTKYFSSVTSNFNYIDNLNNTIINNLSYVIIVWLLGISIIGLPIIIFMYFSKIFILGFTISSFIMTYKFKGILLSFIYLFPSYVVLIILFTLLTLYATKMSCNLIYSIFKKKDVNFKKIINKYLLILFISLLGILICSLYESFVIPFIFNKLQFLIK